LKYQRFAPLGWKDKGIGKFEFTQKRIDLYWSSKDVIFSKKCFFEIFNALRVMPVKKTGFY